MIRDSAGRPVQAGDVVRFSYGLQPVPVRATVEDIDGTLWAMTPGHTPDRCKLVDLRRVAGEFFKEVER